MHSALTEAQRSGLRVFRNSPEYETICQLLREECDLAKDVLLCADPANHADVLAKHSTARAMRLLGERLLKRIDSEAQSIVVEVKEPSEAEIAEMARKNPEEWLKDA